MFKGFICKELLLLRKWSIFKFEVRLKCLERDGDEILGLDMEESGVKIVGF